MNNILCEVRQLSKNFSGRSVLDSVSVRLLSGECVCLFGHNGSGKSTLLSIMSGVSRQSGGSLFIFGAEPSTKMFKKVGYCPQNSALIEELTVIDNIRLWKKAYGSKKAEKDILESFNLSSFSTKKVRALSGGMKKGVMLAIAFLNEPEIVILDEPFAALDSSRADILRKKIALAKQNGTAVVMSSHNADEVLGVMDRALVIKDGRFSAAFTKDELSDDPSDAFSKLYTFF